MTATAAFRAALGPPPGTVGAAGLLGLEHEYRLRRDGGFVDFRDLIHSGTVPGRRLDPGDTNAYRCPSGLAVTCDDAEAEIASPPVPLGPAFTHELDAWAHAGHGVLASVLPDGVALEGFSTHLSAAVPDEEAEPIAAAFARTFAPALMLVLDRPASHGVFVRARPERLELCGDYALGGRLRAAAAFFAGAVRVCATGSDLPPALAVRTVAARGRFGIEVDSRRAFGFDFYRGGRDASLPKADGTTVRIRAYLVDAWTSARGALEGHAASADLDACDRVVEGSDPLGVETVADEAPQVVSPPGPSPFGDLLVPRARPGYAVSPVLATWAYTVFELAGAGRSGYASVPRPLLGTFLARLDGGALDAVLGGFLRTAPAGLRLADVSQTRQPGLWDVLSPSTRLVAAEPGPANRSTGKAGRPAGPRPGKRSAGPPPPSPPTPDRPPPPGPPPPPPEPHGPGPDDVPRPPAPGPTPPPAEPRQRDPVTIPPGPRAPAPDDRTQEPGARPAPDSRTQEPAPSPRPQPYRPPTPAAWEAFESEPAADPQPYRAPTPAPWETFDPEPEVERTPGMGIPKVRDRQRERRRRRLTGAVLVIFALLVGGLGAFGLLGGADKDATVEGVATTVQPPFTRTAPSTTGVTVTTTATTALPPTTAVPPPSTTTPTTVVVTTVPTTVPPPTVTTASTSTTTTTAQFVVTVGAGCTFQPDLATRPVGSTVTFRNATNDTVEITGTGPPGTGDVRFSLEANGQSGAAPLPAVGAYRYNCKGPPGSGSLILVAV